MSVAIITGADSGIGKATAVRLAEHGHDVGITWHEDREGAEDTAAEVEGLGRRVELRQADFHDPSEAARAVEDLADALGGLDIMVNNAGTGASTPFLEVSLDEWRHVLDVDLTAAFCAGQAAARRMVAAGQGGRIVNITSVHEHVPLPGSSAYCAAKGGLGLLTKVMALELAEHGITVNAVAPGEIATPMTGGHDEDPAGRERPGIPAGRPGDAHEIAAAVAYLVSPDARYTTGTSLIVDGGMLLVPAVRNLDTA
jgi:NAD(P)-dependent dehydrogenase (short-subunit alcohol dehydrogenase family)